MELENIFKIYNENKNNEVQVLKDVFLKFEKGKFYAIMGRSGSGKTTLINILGLLENFTSGNYKFNSKDVSKLTEKEKANIRNKEIGFVFQSYYLDNKLTALENVILPTLINKNISNKERKSKAKELLDKFKLSNRIEHYPSELSGGECQRVAIARALVNDPKFIIADEPTGNLDAKNEEIIFNLLKDISKDGKCVIVVTHNNMITKYCDKVYYINDGVVREYED